MQIYITIRRSQPQMIGEFLILNENSESEAIRKKSRQISRGTLISSYITYILIINNNLL